MCRNAFTAPAGRGGGRGRSWAPEDNVEGQPPPQPRLDP